MKNFLQCTIMVIVLIPPAARCADLQAVYVGDWPDEGKEAFEYAMTVWEHYLEEQMAIKIRASFEPHAGTAAGSAGYVTRRPLQVTEFDTLLIPIALHGQLTGNTSGATLAEATAAGDQTLQGFHIAASFDSDFEHEGQTVGFPWYFGTEMDPGESVYRDGSVPIGSSVPQVDFITVALHEIAHGLGFVSSMKYDGTPLGTPPFALPSSFDYCIVVDFLDGFDSFMSYPPSYRSYFMTNGECDTFWYGYFGTAGFGRYLQRALQQDLPYPLSCSRFGYPGMYTPLGWEEGSSMSHFARSSESTMLMAPTGYPPAMTLYRDVGYTHFALQDLLWEISPSNFRCPSPQVFRADPFLTVRSESASAMVRLSNNSEGSQFVLDAKIMGDAATDFQVSASSLDYPYILPPLSSLPIFLDFVPESEGKKEAYLSLVIQSSEVIAYNAHPERS